MLLLLYVTIFILYFYLWAGQSNINICLIMTMLMFTFAIWSVSHQVGGRYSLRTTSPQFFRPWRFRKNFGRRFGLVAFFSKIWRKCWKIIISCKKLENLYLLMVLAKYYWAGCIFIPNESYFSIEFKYTFIIFLEQWKIR